MAPAGSASTSSNAAVNGLQDKAGRMRRDEVRPRRTDDVTRLGMVVGPEKEVRTGSPLGTRGWIYRQPPRALNARNLMAGSR
jgi:hypothetical protein